MSYSETLTQAELTNPTDRRMEKCSQLINSLAAGNPVYNIVKHVIDRPACGYNLRTQHVHTKCVKTDRFKNSVTCKFASELHVN